VKKQLTEETAASFLRTIEFSEKVRKTQHQKPEFGPEPGQIQKKTCKRAH
jgi:hypothetical protein